MDNNVTEIIKQAEADVQKYEALVASADARVAAAQADANALRGELSEAQIALGWLSRHSSLQPVPASAPSQNGYSYPAMRFGKPVPDGPPKLDHIVVALRDLGGIASNKQLSARLLRDGIEITPDQVRGLLKYASTKKAPVVTTEPGSGVWRLNDAGGAH